MKIKRIRAKGKGTNTAHVTVTVDDDPNNAVATVDVFIKEKNGQPNPEPATTTLYFKYSQGEERYFSADASFDADPEGYYYDMTATMYDANGQKLGSSLTENVEVEAVQEEVA